MLRGKLNRLTRRAKGYANSVGPPANLLASIFCNNFKLNATTHYKVRMPAQVSH